SVKGRNDFMAHADSRPHDAEIKAVETAIRFQKESGAKTHITHLTTARAAELVRDAKQQGQDTTCDTCPTYLFMTTKDLEKKGAHAKTNPPVRNESDVSALWNGIKNNEIDIISTDHAPHTIDEKNKIFFDAPAGVPGVEMRVPLLLDAVNNEKITLEAFVKTCSTNPAKRFGLKERGELKEENFADIIVVDMNLEKEVKRDEQHTKCGWSPYEGRLLKGWPIMTFVNGKLVYDLNKFYENKGENLFPQPSS
ncbi:MAG: dihydroorotase family protein, partial [Candidatus Aenigmarchaeota archaeon]|nr:dihydroorotase family protein [Candidatus Aenigmarchaeota archaeon]